ncbi:GbsR/MarR family transcriptional regulator [Polaribacter sp. IC073]|uniref:GbsR/MarR family transcriptional regulator n=1 Tax=Polaribacter sp. IC073 TaxID=2508540 RepID=UPI0011BEB55F|nr:helix-turn-helix domain-containing protein [Polaribacter sp. IC073]TXD47206.1 MarR family transcriptional regulator [Polaribacter sp. IC073]
MSKSKNKELLELIEKLGFDIEERLRLSPLASRIYALLILSSYDGVTFEEVKETIKASKSSISVNINVLIQLGYITFITKPGDRKRYFKIAKYSSILSLEIYLQSIDNEMKIVNRINKFNQEYHPEKYINEKSLGNIFQNYLEQKEQLVKETILKMSNFRKLDK